MNNEPVAWMYRMRDSQNKWELIFNKPINDEFFETVPLYTHPAKTLTMAEMEDFINAYGMDMGDRYEFTFAQLTKMIVEIEHQIKGEK